MNLSKEGRDCGMFLCVWIPQVRDTISRTDLWSSTDPDVKPMKGATCFQVRLDRNNCQHGRRIKRSGTADRNSMVEIALFGGKGDCDFI